MNNKKIKPNEIAMRAFVSKFLLQKHLALENLDYIEFEELSLSPLIHFKNDLKNEVNIDKINSEVYIISVLSNNYSNTCSILNDNEQSTDSHEYCL